MIPFAVDIVLCPSPPLCWLTTSFVSESEDVTSSILLHVYSSIEVGFNFSTINDLFAVGVDPLNITKMFDSSTAITKTSSSIILLAFPSFAHYVLSN